LGEVYDGSYLEEDISVVYPCKDKGFVGRWNIINHNISEEHQMEIVKQNSIFGMQYYLVPLCEDAQIYEKLF